VDVEGDSRSERDEGLDESTRLLKGHVIVARHEFCDIVQIPVTSQRSQQRRQNCY